MKRAVFDLAYPDVSLQDAGGKGLNLARLRQAGLPVPPGFIISTAAYQVFTASNEIQEMVVELAAGADSADPASLDSTAARIRELFDASLIPQEVAWAIAAEYQRLAGGDPLPVAVRSSATAEDLPGMSFAGQQETYLNVIGIDKVLAAVRDCWASLWTARAIGYRARNGIPPQDVALAVVVQEMVPSEASGVLFTANPVTGHRGEMVIDASFGLGEAVVSGKVEPDRYIVRRAGQDWAVAERTLGAKATVTVPVEGGGIAHQNADGASRQALPDEQILTLAALAHHVAGRMDSPQDIEWAWAGGKLHLLQSRPITALYPLPEAATRATGLHVYFNANAVQGVAEPLMPLTLGLFRIVADGLARFLGVQAGAGDSLAIAGGRLFVDITPALTDPAKRKWAMAVFRRADPIVAKAIPLLVEQGRIIDSPNRFPGKLPRAPIISRVLPALPFPGRTIQAALQEVEDFLRAARSRLDAETGLAGTIRSLRTELPRLFPDVVVAIGPFLAMGLAILTQVDRLLVEWLGEKPGASLQLLRGIPGNVTTEMDLKLWEVARVIGADATAKKAFLALSPAEAVAAYRGGLLPPVARNGIAGFLAAYGMRGAGEIDLGRPRWDDDPGSLLQTVAGYLDLSDPAQAPDAVFERGERQSAELLAAYQARLRHGPLGFIKAHLLGEAVRRTRLLTAIRESPKYALIRFFYPYRQRLLQHGAALAERNLLDQAVDIFYLPLDVVSKLGEGGEGLADLEGTLRETARAGRAEYERERSRPRAPRILMSTGEAFYEAPAQPAEAGDLVGDPVSPGVAVGPVRVVRDPRGVRLVPGEILVCPGTDPGWTPLFLTAGALVMEMGGVVTHGAVVAREYGLPAVVGIRQATTLLHDGQRVRVDGSAGRVTMLDGEGSAVRP